MRSGTHFTQLNVFLLLTVVVTKHVWPYFQSRFPKTSSERVSSRQIRLTSLNPTLNQKHTEHSQTPRAMVETNKQPGYGAVDVPPGGTEEFDESNTYYLNESGFTLNRFFRAVVPIVIALVIMSGFGYGMSHG